MSEEVKHTALPWRIDPRASTHVVAEARPICSVSYRSTSLPDGGLRENIANAAFICRAVNSHDSLKEALERITALTPGGPHISAKDGMGAALAALDRARDIARQALKEAE